MRRTDRRSQPKDRDGLIAAFNAANVEGATDQQIDDLAIAIAKASMEPKFRSAMNDIPGGEDMRKSGNALAKYNDGQKEAPAGPAEREFIRNVFGQMLAELRTQPEYADLQAVLCYAEKRLYETAKEDVAAGDDVSGYEDDEAPDYANAAAGVARANGVPEIKAAFKRVSKDGRAAAARRSGGGTEGEKLDPGSKQRLEDLIAAKSASSSKPEPSTGFHPLAEAMQRHGLTEQEAREMAEKFRFKRTSAFATLKSGRRAGHWLPSSGPTASGRRSFTNLSRAIRRMRKPLSGRLAQAATLSEGSASPFRFTLPRTMPVCGFPDQGR